VGLVTFTAIQSHHVTVVFYQCFDRPVNNIVCETGL